MVNAVISGNAVVCGDTQVYDHASVYISAKVYGNAEVYGDGEVCGNAEVHGHAIICGDAEVCGDSWSETPLCIHGSQYNFMMVTKTKIRIGHDTHTFEEWSTLYKDITAKHGYIQDNYIEYIRYFNLACEIYNRPECTVTL